MKDNGHGEHPSNAIQKTNEKGQIYQNVFVGRLLTTVIGGDDIFQDRKHPKARVALVDVSQCLTVKEKIDAVAQISELVKRSGQHTSTDHKWATEFVRQFVIHEDNIDILPKHEFVAMLPGLGIIATSLAMVERHNEFVPLEKRTPYTQAILISDDGIYQRTLYLAEDGFDRRCS